MNFEQSIALVTGANRGLGLAFVRQLLGRGDHVVAACRHPGKATALNSLGGEHPGRLHVLPREGTRPQRGGRARVGITRATQTSKWDGSQEWGKLTHPSAF